MKMNDTEDLQKRVRMGSDARYLDSSFVKIRNVLCTGGREFPAFLCWILCGHVRPWYW
jgi:hypothetical protein